MNPHSLLINSMTSETVFFSTRNSWRSWSFLDSQSNDIFAVCLYLDVRMFVVFDPVGKIGLFFQGRQQQSLSEGNIKKNGFDGKSIRRGGSLIE